jgi:hypothetical protein
MPATNYSTYDAKVLKSERTAIESKTESHSTSDKQASSFKKHKTEESTTQIDEDAELVASLGDYVCY